MTLHSLNPPPPPPPPPLMGDNLEKERLYRNGGIATLLLYNSIAFTVCGGKKESFLNYILIIQSLELAMKDSHYNMNFNIACIIFPCF